MVFNHNSNFEHNRNFFVRRRIIVIMKKIILAISLLLILALMIGTPTALSGGKKVFYIEISITEDGTVQEVRVNKKPVEKTKFPLPVGNIKAETSMEVWITEVNPCYIIIVINGVPHKIPYPC